MQGRRHGVDMSTPLLPEAIPEIDANPMFFWRASRGGGSVSGPVCLSLLSVSMSSWWILMTEMIQLIFDVVLFCTVCSYYSAILTDQYVMFVSL